MKGLDKIYLVNLQKDKDRLDTGGSCSGEDAIVGLNITDIITLDRMRDTSIHINSRRGGCSKS